MQLSCDLTIPEYWAQNKRTIAKLRNWEFTKNEDGSFACPTLDGYDRQMQRIAPNLQKAICDTTFFDLQTAMEKVRYSRKGGKVYSLSTMASYRSMLSDIYRYAQDRGDAYNILSYFFARGKKVMNEAIKPIAEVIDPTLPKAVMLGRLRAALEERIYLPRSLQPEQQAHLIRLLVDNIGEDGRYCGVAIMLYAGLRPAECRALRWKDIIPFADHPDRHMIYVHDSLDHRGKRKGRVKTQNAYRKVPVHIELEQILQKRRQTIEVSLKAEGKNADIGDYPICCMGNEYGKTCRDYQMSILAAEILDSLSITKEELSTYLLDLIAEREEKGEESGDLHLSSYVLRRNFWTWLQSSTQLTEMEKRYVMGHEMLDGAIDLRPSFNNPETLWNICRQMDKHAISLRLHHKYIEMSIQQGQDISFENCGIARIRIPKEQLASGGTLHIQALTNESGDKVIIEARSVVRPFGKLVVKGKVVNCVPPERWPTGINCEYDNYQVLENLRN